MVGLACSNDPDSYAGVIMAIGRASHAREFKGDDPDEKGYPGPPVWWMGMGLTSTPNRNCVLLKIVSRMLRTILKKAKVHQGL
jgi:hypothetical protein